MIEIVGEQSFDALMTGLAQFGQQIKAQLHVRRADQFAGRCIDIVFSSNFTRDVLNRNFDKLNIVFFQLADMASGNTACFFYVDLTVRFDVEGRGFTTQTLRNQLHLQLVVANFKDHFFEEQVKDLLSGVIQRAQDDRCRQLTTTVDTDKQVVFRIEFEVQPGTAVRDDTCVIQDLTGRVSLTFVTVKEDARATVQLRNDNTLSTVDNKGTVVGHERNFAHVDFLFFDVFNGAFRRFTLVDHQTQFYAQRCRIGHATDLTFFNIKYWFAQTVADVLQLGITAVAFNREHGTEGCFQTILPFRILLDKLLERIKLDRKEIRYVQNLWTFTKILTNTFFLGIGVNHRVPQLADKSTRLPQKGSFLCNTILWTGKWNTFRNTCCYHA
ncbi:hypothetical protein D3C80_757860 [compost metagenome]